MKISNVAFYRYRLPLVTALNIKKNQILYRDGLLLKITSQAGVIAFGEAAPLEGFSLDSLDDILDKLAVLKNWLIYHEIPNSIEKLNGQLFVWLEPLHLSPSLQFAVEMACLNLVANSRKKPLYQLISDQTHDSIRINGLLTGSKDEVVAQAQNLCEQGFRSLKLKVGGDVLADAEKVKSINTAVNGRAVLHVDANQSWDPDAAIAFGNEIGCAAIDYIEEPFEDTTQIPRFFSETLIPVALDESLLKIPFDQIKRIDGLDFLILKPTILGGIEKTWKIMEAAKVQAIRPVISSAFESSLGVLTLAQLAGGSARDIHCGLDTLKWLQKDLLKSPLSLDHGTIAIQNSFVDETDINYDVLTPIEI